MPREAALGDVEGGGEDREQVGTQPVADCGRGG
jgi:hypothetical protein